MLWVLSPCGFLINECFLNRGLLQVAHFEERLVELEGDSSLDWIAAHSKRHDLNQRQEVWRQAKAHIQRVDDRLRNIEDRLLSRGWRPIFWRFRS